MANISVLGIFEDHPQRAFHTGLLRRVSEMAGHELIVEARITRGCRFDYLAEHLSDHARFDGVIVGVDGKKRGVNAKIQALQAGLSDVGFAGVPNHILWAVALPCIEEWLMADEELLPSVLSELLGARINPRAVRPSKAGAEQTAKSRLRDWVTDLVGRPLLRGGLEYAEDVGYRMNPNRIGRARNSDLHTYVSNLPQFLDRCV